MYWMAAIGLLAMAGTVHGQGQASMSIKAETEYKQADQEMNGIWRQVSAAMTALDAQNTSRGGGFGFAATALNAQRKWLVLRDQQCSIEEAIFQGGSMAPMVGDQCKTRMTKERTADLQSLLGQTK